MKMQENSRAATGRKGGREGGRERSHTSPKAREGGGSVREGEGVKAEWEAALYESNRGLAEEKEAEEELLPEQKCKCLVWKSTKSAS